MFLLISLLLCLTLALLIVFRNFILKTALEAFIQYETGLQLKVRNFSLGITSRVIEFEELVLLNPKGFPEPVMVFAPQLYLEYQPGSFLKGKSHFNLIRIDLQKFNVIKTADGKVNLDALKTVKKERAEEAREAALPPEPEKKKTEFRIDSLELKIGEVNIVDYTKDPHGASRKFIIDLNEKYTNVTNFDDIAKIILVKALTNTTISDITNLDIKNLTEDASVFLDGGVKIIGKTFEGVTDTTTNLFKNTFGFITDSVGLTEKEKK
jgi:hypothetical protein